MTPISVFEQTVLDDPSLQQSWRQMDPTAPQRAGRRSPSGAQDEPPQTSLDHPCSHCPGVSIVSSIQGRRARARAPFSSGWMTASRIRPLGRPPYLHSRQGQVKVQPRPDRDPEGLTRPGPGCTSSTSMRRRSSFAATHRRARGRPSTDEAPSPLRLENLEQVSYLIILNRANECIEYMISIPGKESSESHALRNYHS